MRRSETTAAEVRGVRARRGKAEAVHSLEMMEEVRWKAKMVTSSDPVVQCDKAAMVRQIRWRAEMFQKEFPHTALTAVTPCAT